MGGKVSSQETQLPRWPRHDDDAADEDDDDDGYYSMAIAHARSWVKKSMFLTMSKLPSWRTVTT